MKSLLTGRCCGPRFRRPLTAATAGLFVVHLVTSGVAAQQPAKDVVGTGQLRTLELEAYAAGAGRGDTEPVELAALRMLALARQDISELRLEPARRALELLIARYPESASASPARRELFKLYAVDPQINETGQTAKSATPERQAGDAASGWRTSVVSFRRLQDEFRNSIGDRVFFSAGSDEIGGRARAVLAVQAKWLASRPQVEVVVEGHADDAMAGADNEVVSANRARAVRDRLIAEGVEPGRIVLTPKGNTDPVATCSDSDCAAQNRRAVIVVGVRGLGGVLESEPAALESQPGHQQGRR